MGLLDKLMAGWSKAGDKDFLENDATEHQAQLRKKYESGGKLSEEEARSMSDEDRKKYRMRQQQG